jgi:hypothetical protein
MFEERRAEVSTASLVIALAVNFLFDFTYFVPSLLWIWFWLLGAQDVNRYRVIGRG